MVRIAASDASDPITCLWGSPTNIIIGTAAGLVRLFFRSSSTAEAWSSVLLCKRSPEAIAGLCMTQRHEVLAVVGDRHLLRWDLNTLEYDKPLVKGCRFDQVDFIIPHSIAVCPRSTTMTQEMPGGDARVVILREDGDCCYMDTSRLEQRLIGNFGPLPEIDTKLSPIAFNGGSVIWTTIRYGGRIDLRLLTLFSDSVGPHVEISPRKGPVKGVKFLKDDGAIILLGKKLWYWSFKQGNLLHRLESCPDVEIFDVVSARDLQNRNFVISACPRGTISLGEFNPGEKVTDGISYRMVAATRKQSNSARFHLNFPYSIKCVPQPNGSTLILFNDDTGMYVEEDLFVLN